MIHGKTAAHWTARLLWLVVVVLGYRSLVDFGPQRSLGYTVQMLVMFGIYVAGDALLGWAFSWYRAIGEGDPIESEREEAADSASRCISAIRSDVAGQDVELEIERRDESTFNLLFTRASLSFEVTACFLALEWWVVIADEDAELRFKDWCDYVGYDRRPRGELTEEMTEDLRELMTTLLSNEFRLAKGATRLRPSDRCEWLVDGRWVEFDYGETFDDVEA